MTVAKRIRAAPGRHPPGPRPELALGATVVDGGVNFSLFSRTAAGVELLFFDREDDATPSRVVRLDPAANRTYHYWHTFVPGVQPGQIYGYRGRRAVRPRDAGCGSTRQRCCSTRTAAAWSSRRATTARPRDGRATTPRPR